MKANPQSFLFAVHVGPVQDFIVAARRTKDLWAGSRMLSQISLSVAHALKNEGAELIFPCLPEGLEERHSNAEADSNETIGVANVIISIVSTGQEIPEINTWAQVARSAADNRWREFVAYAEKIASVNGVRDKIQFSNLSIIREDLWKQQLDGVVELYCAWVPLEKNASLDWQDYAKQRTRLMQILNGRKNLKDFLPNSINVDGIPKSSLDGARESVLLKDAYKILQGESQIDNGSEKRGTGALRSLLKLAQGEQLDLVGFVKRAQDMKFVSVSQVAAIPWMLVAQERCKEEWALLMEKGKRLQGKGIEMFAPIRSSNGKIEALFPFDAELLYKNRHSVIDSRYLDPKTNSYSDRSSEEALHEFIPLLVPLKHEIGEPSPYLAILQADGDRMGKLLQQMESPDEHRRISEALAQFSQDARKLLQKQYGECIYAGGDDVLGLVPLTKVLEVSSKLHDLFSQILKTPIEEIAKKRNNNTEIETPTLSVGIAIAHSLTPLEELRQYAREAEKKAKNPTMPSEGDERNGFSIVMHPRSGSIYGFRARWSDSDSIANHSEEIVSAFDQLSHICEWFRRALLSRGIAYDFQELARLHKGWDAKNSKDALRNEMELILKRKKVPIIDSLIDEQGQRQQKYPSEYGILQRILNGIHSAQDLERFAVLLRIAMELVPSFERERFEKNRKSEVAS